MAQNKFAFARYQIIDCLLRSNAFVKTSEIAEMCFFKTGFRVSTRTIQMDIEAMKYDSFLAFYAPIEYHNGMKAYYYCKDCYRLNTLLRFSSEELSAVKRILAICDKWDSLQHYSIFKEAVSKMELFADMSQKKAIAK